MSHAAVTWALEQRLPALQKLVLLMLCHRHNAKTGRCDPSIQCIADDCGMSKDAVRTALTKLAALDLVTAEGRRQGEKQISHSYHLAIGMIASGVVAETDGGSSSEPPPLVVESDQGSRSELGGVVAQSHQGVVAETDTNIGTLFNKGIRTVEENNNLPRGKRETKTHPLFGDLKERIFAYYRNHNHIDPPWDGGEARQLSRLLAAQPNADITFWRTCLFGRHNSDVNHAERPRMWLSNLASYHKPLNAYNRPKETEHARNQSPTQRRHAEAGKALRDIQSRRMDAASQSPANHQGRPGVDVHLPSVGPSGHRDFGSLRRALVEGERNGSDASP